MIENHIIRPMKTKRIESNDGIFAFRFGLKNKGNHQYNHTIELKQYNELQRGYSEYNYNFKVKSSVKRRSDVLDARTIGKTRKETNKLVTPLEPQSTEVAGLGNTLSTTIRSEQTAGKSVGDQNTTSELLHAGLRHITILDKITK